MRQVRCHWLTWGKPLAAGRLDGAVVPGSEHGVTRVSAGFPEPLMAQCTMSSLVGRGMGASAAVDPDTGRSGAFVYRPVICAAGSFCLFARIRSLPELGRERVGGRFYNHLSFLAFPLRDWNSDMLPAMHRALFDDRYGQPDREDDTGRTNCPPPVIPVGKDAPRADAQRQAGFSVAAPDGSALLLSADTMLAAVHGLARVLDAAPLGRGVLAALPWAMGLDPQATGTGSGFAARLVPAGSAALPWNGEDVLGAVLRPSLWVSFADCLGPDGAPCWGVLPASGRKRPLPPAAAAIADLARDFDLPPPWNHVGFADFLMDVTHDGRELAEHWPGLFACWPEIAALTRFGTDSTGIARSIDEMLRKAAARGIDLSPPTNPLLDAAIEIWSRLVDVRNGQAIADTRGGP